MGVMLKDKKTAPRLGTKAMNATLSKTTLRPYSPPTSASQRNRFAAIEELTVDDYDEAQRRAWASIVDDDEAFAKNLENNLTSRAGSAAVRLVLSS